MNNFKTLNKQLMFLTSLVIFLIIIFLLFPSTLKAKSNRMNKTTLTNNQLYIYKQDKKISQTGTIIYGNSGLGRTLICNKIAPVTPPKGKILLNYEIHGYEGGYQKDGQLLVDIANKVTDYFVRNRGLLNGYELYIVPSSNPDGLMNGTTQYGKGRCQISKGVDINRDFDSNYVPFRNDTNFTLKPFSVPESQGLRDLVESLKPVVVLDCHGWENQMIGNSKIAKCFQQPLQIGQYKSFNSGYHGYFSLWSSQHGAQSLLVEYPKQAINNENYYVHATSLGIENLIKFLG